MKIQNKNYLSFLVVILFVVILFLIPHKKDLADIKGVDVAGYKVKVDLALNAVHREQGLSGRRSLNEDEGMLFIFDKLGRYNFWMKDMFLSIDIIWLVPLGSMNEEAKIVYIKKDARPESYPETYGPEGHTLYVLEVVSGFVEKTNLKVGDTVKFTY